MNAPVIPVPAPSTLNLLVGLFRNYLSLEADQVVVYNQKWKIPSDSRLYLSVGYLNQKPFGVTRVYSEFTEGKTSGLKELISINSQETISVNAYSRGRAAMDYKDLIPLALGSTEAQQLCEVNSIKLGYLPTSMVDLSALEGAAILTRFGITFNALVARRQERIVRYYDQFQTPTLLINQ